MNKRSKEFLEKRKQLKLQQAWDMLSDYMVATSDGAHTHFVGIVENGHYGYMVLYNSSQGNKLISTKKYK